MSNPNTTTVYDPKGEAFEMSKANARDLVAHMGWSFSKPTVIVKEVAAEEEAPACEVPTETESTPTEEAPAAVEEAAAEEAPAEEAAAEEAPEETAAPAADAPFTTEEQFAELTERDQLVEYLGKHFPDFKPHHKAGRDSLVAKAIELATA